MVARDFLYISTVEAGSLSIFSVKKNINDDKMMMHAPRVKRGVKMKESKQVSEHNKEINIQIYPSFFFICASEKGRNMRNNR